MAEKLITNIAKRLEKGYKLYLIRNTKDAKNEGIQKHLRASRKFEVSTSPIFKDQEVDPRISDIIKTNLNAYVYVKKGDVVAEYKVVTKDIYLNTKDTEIQYTVKKGEVLSVIANNHNTTVQKIVDYNNIVDKDKVPENTKITIVSEKTSIKKIPTIHYEKIITSIIDKKYKYVYEEAIRSIHIDSSYEKVSVYYVNTKLQRTSEDKIKNLDKFTAMEINLKKLSENSFYTKNIDNIELKEITNNDKKNNTNVKRTNQDIISVVAIIDDELGVVEDLYDYYETSFKTNYSENLPIIKQIKDENTYVYTVSKQINYFYVTKEIAEKHAENVKKLHNTFDLFSHEIFNGKIKSKLFDTDGAVFDSLISDFYSVQKYKTRIEIVNKSFFSKWNPIYVFGDIYINQRTGSSTHTKGIVDNYADMLSMYDEYEANRKNFFHMLILSVMFSDAYEKEIQDNKGLKKARDEFREVLNMMEALPAIQEDDIKNIRDEINDDQSRYKDMFTSEESLLVQFEELDDLQKQVSLFHTIDKDIHKNKNLNKLYLHDKLKTFKEFKAEDSPISILKHLETYLNTKEIKTLLEAYTNVEPFETDNTMYANNYYDMQNIILMLSKNISYTDEEKNITSCFNTDLEYIVEFMFHNYKKLSDLDNKVDSWIKIQDDNPDFFEANAAMMNVLFGHSLVERGNNDADNGHLVRHNNVVKLSNDILSHKSSKYKIDFNSSPDKDKINLMNKVDKLILPEQFDAEQKTQYNAMAIYETLNAINGYTKILENLDSAMQKKNEIILKIKMKNKEISKREKHLKSSKTKKDNFQKDTEKRIENKKNNKNMTPEKYNEYVQKKEQSLQQVNSHHNKQIERLQKEIRILESKKDIEKGNINRFKNSGVIEDVDRYKHINSKTYQKTLFATKISSAILGVWGVYNFAISYEKRKISNLVNLLSDLTTIAGASLAQASQWLSKKPSMARTSLVLGKANINVGRFAGRLGIAILIYTETNRYMDLDESDTDAKVVILVGGILQVGILLLISLNPASAVLWGIYIAVFALYELLLYYMVNSQVENYIIASIFGKDGNYKAKILKEVLNNENIENVPNFNTPKEIQKYLGDNHKELKPIFQSALKQEISELTRSLHGYKLELFVGELDKRAKENFDRETGIKIPKSFFKDNSFKMIVVDDKGGYEYVKVLDSSLVENYYVVDLLIPRFSATYINRINNKNFSIIVITNNISMKYNYTYFNKEHTIRKYTYTYTICINNFEKTFLNQKDEKYIQGLK